MKFVIFMVFYEGYDTSFASRKRGEGLHFTTVVALSKRDVIKIEKINGKEKFTL